MLKSILSIGAAVIFVAFVAIMQLTLFSKINEQTSKTEALTQQIQDLKIQTAAAKESINSKQDKSKVYERIARERLGLVFPNEQLFVSSTPYTPTPIVIS